VDPNLDPISFNAIAVENDLSVDYALVPDQYPGSNTGKTTIAYRDGTYVAVEEDYLILEINEENVPFANENFDIEVFKVEDAEEGNITTPGITNETQREVLTRLMFSKETNAIQNNILLDDKDLQNIAPPIIGEHNVEYYIDFKFDDAIPEEILCKLVSRQIPTNVFDSSRTLECDDTQQTEQLNRDPYGEGE
jgi:hypothetical protein